MRIMQLSIRHGTIGFRPRGRIFSKMTVDGHWRGVIVRLGKRWRGVLFVKH